MIFNTHLKISKSNSIQLFQEFGEEGMFPNSFNEVSITLALKSEKDIAKIETIYQYPLRTQMQNL